MRTFLLIILAAMFSGCAEMPKSLPADRKPLPKFITLVWSTGFSQSAVAAWEAQIIQRWPDRNVAVVFCHGTDDGHPWQLAPDAPLKHMPVENAAAMLHAILPGRLLVIVSCNHSAADIKTPDVAFARKRVWIRPGPDERYSLDDDAVVNDAGNIWEFEVTKERQ